MSLTLSEAGIFSTFLEAILYGFSVLMFIFTMWIVLSNKRRRRLNYGMLGASWAIFILSTAEMAVNIARVRRGFLSIGPNLPGGPEEFFLRVGEITFVVKSVLYNAQTLILDGVMIYRTYVVWQSLLVIVLPCIGWCGLLVAVIGTNIALATAPAHATDVFAVQIGRWITANYSMTLATNLMATTLLAYRIWQVKRQSSRFVSTYNPLSPILRIVIESGAIYSMTITTALITFASKSNGVYIVLDIISPIISIVFNMITVRVGLASDQRLSGPNSVNQSGYGSEFRAYRPAGTSLAIEITHCIETDDASLSETPRPLSVKSEPNTFSPAVHHVPSTNSIPPSYAL